MTNLMKVTLLIQNLKLCRDTQTPCWSHATEYLFSLG